MKKNNVVSLANQQVAARRNFSAHVQSVAFNLTLSKNMIGTLQWVRDWGFPRNEPHVGWFDKKNLIPRTASGADFFITFVRGLINRGLVIHNEPNVGKQAYELSNAGRLVCDLLVESGIMPASETRTVKGRVKP